MCASTANESWKGGKTQHEPRKKTGLTFHYTGWLIGIRDPYNGLFIIIPK